MKNFVNYTDGRKDSPGLRHERVSPLGTMRSLGSLSLGEEDVEKDSINIDPNVLHGSW